MTMPTLLEITGEVACIILTGVFDFSVQENFRQTIKEALNDERIREISVDMDAVTFMDSSAIGLLLLLNEKASSQGKTVVLVNCHDPVREIFSIGGFDSILKII
jgi:anti-anti-sigma factor